MLRKTLRLLLQRYYYHEVLGVVDSIVQSILLVVFREVVMLKLMICVLTLPTLKRRYLSKHNSFSCFCRVRMYEYHEYG